ncbi:MAG: TonB-dependent receptor [Candidatus Neomarinimicrobiota bacterium]|nr:MAG: TonB-dependent receptor [Candidatus Neomarinimicrobiota bacterium]
MKYRISFFSLLLALVLVPLAGQTTGKIAGTVVDKDTQEPLPGVNVFLEGMGIGAATDENGSFFILNVAPGTYTVIAQMIGYTELRMEGIKVSVNRTAYLKAELEPTVLEGQEVVVTASAISQKKDQTGTTKNISADQMDVLPVENIGEIIQMQAGVVEGHFRGGRNTEVSYMIDGLVVDEVVGGTGSTVDLEADAVQDLEVITGTFNAEYGRAMSGIVNQVTKSGSREFHGSVSGAVENYFTPHKDIFIGIDQPDINRNTDVKFQLSGPVWGDKITFFINSRLQDNQGHLNGIERFLVDDYSDFTSPDSLDWISEHNGSGNLVPMNVTQNQSLMGKLSFNLWKHFRWNLLYTRNNDIWRWYDHFYKYNPNGRPHSVRDAHMLAVQVNHMLSNALFYEFKFSQTYNYGGTYVYKDPMDARYVHDKYFNSYGPGFLTGGQSKDHSYRETRDATVKFDLNWQANPRHSLKAGYLGIHHDITNTWHQIRNKYYGTSNEFDLYEPIILPDSTIYADIYHVKPVEQSAYIQDKMEFDDMVINLGLRYDYFDPAATYPSQRRNPGNQQIFDNPDSMSHPVPADPKFQWSPRFGLAYQLGNAAVLHFSYGHFFQMPPFYALYQNHSLRVGPDDYSTVMGNPQVKAEKTVSYEIGLWQELSRGMGLEVSLFYRDIYDLLSTKIISTFNQIEYGLYTNKDYGNVRGLEVKYDFTRRPLAIFVNYTLQYTRGNADYPREAFDREGSQTDPVNRLIPLNWDQRNTFNATVSYERGRGGVSITGYYNSGMPYTYTPLGERLISRINLYPNNDYRPTRYTVDMTAHYALTLGSHFRLKFELLVRNLFDRLNEINVNGQTGRAYTAIIQDTDLAGHRSNFNTYEDRIHDPSAYSAPRSIKLSVGVEF